MKKQPGRIRYVKFEEDCYMSAEDVLGIVKRFDNSYAASLIKEQIESIILSCSNLVPGMEDDKKQEWDDIMKPN